MTELTLRHDRTMSKTGYPWKQGFRVLLEKGGVLPKKTKGLPRTPQKGGSKSDPLGCRLDMYMLTSVTSSWLIHDIDMTSTWQNPCPNGVPLETGVFVYCWKRGVFCRRKLRVLPRTPQKGGSKSDPWEMVSTTTVVCTTTYTTMNHLQTTIPSVFLLVYYVIYVVYG
jgi:hypothetical protein